ncbi:MAG: hypothetical protein ACKOQZ_06190, partial [Actinomycetota bacterium]
SESSWRWIYLVGLVWLVCAAIVTRLLPETTRFLAMKNEPPAIEAPRARIDRGRLALQIVVAVFAN